MSSSSSSSSSSPPLVSSTNSFSLGETVQLDTDNNSVQMDKESCSAGAKRKRNKPLIEKRRRARINECLRQLQEIVTEDKQNQTFKTNRLEKADVLEMTVRYVRRMTTKNKQTDAEEYHGQASLSTNTNHATYSRGLEKDDMKQEQQTYECGFRRCIQEVCSFIKAHGTLLKSEGGVELLGHCHSLLQTPLDGDTLNEHKHSAVFSNQQLQEMQRDKSEKNDPFQNVLTTIDTETHFPDSTNFVSSLDILNDDSSTFHAPQIQNQAWQRGMVKATTKTSSNSNAKEKYSLIPDSVHRTEATSSTISYHNILTKRSCEKNSNSNHESSNIVQSSGNTRPSLMLPSTEHCPAFCEGINQLQPLDFSEHFEPLEPHSINPTYTSTSIQTPSSSQNVSNLIQLLSLPPTKDQGQVWILVNRAVPPSDLSFVVQTNGHNSEGSKSKLTLATQDPQTTIGDQHVTSESDIMNLHTSTREATITPTRQHPYRKLFTDNHRSQKISIVDSTNDISPLDLTCSNSVLKNNNYHLHGLQDTQNSHEHKRSASQQDLQSGLSKTTKTFCESVAPSNKVDRHCSYTLLSASSATGNRNIESTGSSSSNNTIDENNGINHHSIKGIYKYNYANISINDSSRSHSDDNNTNNSSNQINNSIINNIDNNINNNNNNYNHQNSYTTNSTSTNKYFSVHPQSANKFRIPTNVQQHAALYKKLNFVSPPKHHPIKEHTEHLPESQPTANPTHPEHLSNQGVYVTPIYTIIPEDNIPQPAYTLHSNTGPYSHVWRPW